MELREQSWNRPSEDQSIIEQRFTLFTTVLCEFTGVWGAGLVDQNWLWDQIQYLGGGVVGGRQMTCCGKGVDTGGE